MSGNFGIRTDLAVESKEKYEKDNVEIKGVAIQEKYEEALDLNTTVVRIQTEQGAKAMEKPKGTLFLILFYGFFSPCLLP